MSEQWRARDSVLCGSLCFLFLVLLHQVRARPEQLVAHTCPNARIVPPPDPPPSPRCPSSLTDPDARQPL
jgi:hypothetical protein